MVQKGRKIYEHELVLNQKLDKTDPMTSLIYTNIRHSIEVKLNFLEAISLIFIWKVGDSFRYFACQLEPRTLPSNYYIQSVKKLYPVNYSIDRNNINI